jgi:hypothetical protein
MADALTTLMNLVQQGNMPSWSQPLPTEYKRALMALAGVSALKWTMDQTKKPVSTYPPLVDAVEAMHCDARVEESFRKLQVYRDLNPWLFSAALQNIDKLLYLSRLLLSGVAKPMREDRGVAFSYLKVGMSRLKALQCTIHQEMGNDHALVANMEIQVIYNQCQKHVLNVMHICSRFKPEDVIERARAEVPRLVRQRRRRYQRHQEQERSREQSDHKERSQERSQERSDHQAQPLDPNMEADPYVSDQDQGHDQGRDHEQDQ